MRVFNSAAQAQLEAGRIIDRGMVRVSFPSGDYGFWTGAGPFLHEGLVFAGAGQALSVDDISQSGDLSPASVTVRLTAISNSGLDPDVLATIENEDYHQRPITLSNAYFHPDTNALISVERVWRGYIDQIVHDLGSSGQPAQLELRCESRALDHARRGYRRRGDADQRRLSADDKFFVHAAIAGSVEVKFGRK